MEPDLSHLEEQLMIFESSLHAWQFIFKGEILSGPLSVENKYLKIKDLGGKSLNRRDHIYFVTATTIPSIITKTPAGFCSNLGFTSLF